MLILTHKDPFILVEWAGRKMKFRRAPCDVHYSNMSLYHRLLYQTAQGQEVIQGLAGKKERSAEDLYATMTALKIRSREDISAVQADLAKYLVSIDGEAPKEVFGEELTPEVLNVAIPLLEPLLELWMLWYMGNEPSEEDRKKNQEGGDSADPPRGGQ